MRSFLRDTVFCMIAATIVITAYFIPARVMELTEWAHRPTIISTSTAMHNLGPILVALLLGCLVIVVSTAVAAVIARCLK